MFLWRTKPCVIYFRYFRYCSNSLSRTNITTIIIPRLKDKRTVFYAYAYYIFFFLCHGSDRLYLGYLGTKYRYRTLKGNHLLLLCMNIGIQACLLAWKWKSSISFLGFFSPFKFASDYARFVMICTLRFCKKKKKNVLLA